ncbi:MAG: transposase [Candidatus Eremiobacteraeota bacterium]|nr:transposase [Candidatus Eremiobacteraeota bacterium]
MVEVPDPEVLERPRRRRFTAKYKLRILKEIDSATLRGEIGAILRREGLYSSHIKSWRKQRERGALAGLSPKKRGTKPVKKDPADVEHINELEKENRRLRKRLERAELLLDIQKKVSELTGIPLRDPGSEESDL